MLYSKDFNEFLSNQIFTVVGEDKQLQINSRLESKQFFKGRMYYDSDKLTEEEAIREYCYYQFVSIHKMYFVPTAENKHVAEDYPYGWNKRCTMYYWVEYSKRGARTCRQSLHDGYLGKPKKSTYSYNYLAYLKENGHLRYISIEEDFMVRKENREEYKQRHIDRLQAIEVLPDYCQLLLAKMTGNEAKKVVNMKFGKLDKSYTVDIAVKTVLDTDSVDRQFIVQNLLKFDKLEEVLIGNGGFRIFLGSSEHGFIDREVLENWKAYYSDVLDPFADEVEKPQLMRIKPIIKKPALPTCVVDGTTVFDKKHLYKYRLWRTSDRVYMARLVKLPAKERKGRYHFKTGKGYNESNYFFYNPIIDADGFLSEYKEPEKVIDLEVKAENPRVEECKPVVKIVDPWNEPEVMEMVEKLNEKQQPEAIKEEKVQLALF